MSYGGAYGALNMPTPQRIAAPKTDSELLKEIMRSLRAIEGEYVTPKLFKRLKQENLAVGDVSQALLCDGNPVNRIIVQVFSTSGLVSVILNNNPSTTELPDFQVAANPFPTVFLVPGLPTDLYIRNDGSVTASFAVFMTSASG